MVSDVVPEAASETIHAKIQSIDPQSRQVVLTEASGRTVTVLAAPQVPLQDLKAGDRVNAHYYLPLGRLPRLEEHAGARPGDPAPT